MFLSGVSMSSHTDSHCEFIRGGSDTKRVRREVVTFDSVLALPPALRKGLKAPCSAHSLPSVFAIIPAYWRWDGEGTGSGCESDRLPLVDGLFSVHPNAEGSRSSVTFKKTTKLASQLSPPVKATSKLAAGSLPLCISVGFD